MAPDGEVGKDFIPDVATALTLKKDFSPQEVWNYYETLAQSRVPPRTYEETMKIRDEFQAELLTKRRRIPKPSLYVAKKQQGEIKSVNITSTPTQKTMYKL